MTGDHAAAQDAVQEAFVRAFTSRRLEGVDNPEAWLRTTALNAARSRWRRLRRLDVLLDVGRETRPVDVRVPGLSPERVALIAALRTLPARQREAIVLHHIADQPVTEVAATLGVPVGTVKAWLSRGRNRLAELLTDDENTMTEVGHD
jgi:RNA polymerase sigma-70 factor (ECF subfamily)